MPPVPPGRGPSQEAGRVHHLALQRQAGFSVSEGEPRRQESRGGSRSRARSACFLLTLPYPHPFPLQPSPPTPIPWWLTGSRAQLPACSVVGFPGGLGAGGEPWSQHSAMSLKAPPSRLSGSLRPALPWLIPGLPSTPAAWCPGSAVPRLGHPTGALGPPPCVRALTRPLVAGSGLGSVPDGLSAGHLPFLFWPARPKGHPPC